LHRIIREGLIQNARCRATRFRLEPLALKEKTRPAG
jgi:hypothetical protein